MQTIPEFTGPQFPFSTDPYAAKAYADVHYTLNLDRDMPPALIAFPRHEKDVRTAIRYARQNGYRISVFTGGHYYDGGVHAPTAPDVQLNLTLTYAGPKHIGLTTVEQWVPYRTKNQLWVGVSQSIGDINRILREDGRFLPHGQCSDVQLVGHGQRGGGGQLGRSFGLLGDRIRAIRILNHTGESEMITTCDPKAHAILGGVAGSFGVVTHYSFQAFADEDFDFPDTNSRPHGFKGVWRYNQPALKLLLNEVATMADDSSLPPNFDLSVNVFSASFPMLRLIPKLKDNPHNPIESTTGEQPGHTNSTWPACIVVFAQWVPMSREDKYTAQVDAWFQRFRDLTTVKNCCIHTEELVQPMSTMTGEWLFRGSREFDLPYIRRMYLTKSRAMAQSGWVETTALQIDRILDTSRASSLSQSCYLAAKIQCLGGNLTQPSDAQFRGESCEKRDWTVSQTLDCFHPADERGEATANEWQSWNDLVFCTLGHALRGLEKRVVWTLSTDWQMDKTWSYYRQVVQTKYDEHVTRKHQTKYKPEKRAKQRAKGQTKLPAIYPKQITNSEQAEHQDQVTSPHQAMNQGSAMSQDATLLSDQPTLQKRPALPKQPTLQKRPRLPKQPARRGRPAMQGQPTSQEQPKLHEEAIYPEQLVFKKPALNPEQAMISEPAILQEAAMFQQFATFQDPAMFQDYPIFQDSAMPREFSMYQQPVTSHDCDMSQELTLAQEYTMKPDLIQDLTASQTLTMSQEPIMNQQHTIFPELAINTWPSMSSQLSNYQKQMDGYYKDCWGVVPDPYSYYTAWQHPQNQPWCAMMATES
ncbi:hypothetical protein G647_08485 [Cladophialophora carrionii CBS 160.54]|uniref:FAD-binding PCMH-type domain-containing protein n=1 Tax=Cladophialophora carrionii CBS 160.54 TaxID=1279043 RepID=V9D0L0_9EURO|nr:uncharacterized protein G647_08485 [Cladophialophora carrionii CBS 160.54]ETI20449.1 hypothetical protein G647_08485 [Cladophialophora carrionii CBS 160.54]